MSELAAKPLPFICRLCKVPLNGKEDAQTAAQDGTCKMCYDRWVATGRTPADSQEWDEYMQVRKLKWLNFPLMPTG
jgi:hypothetical protein